MCPKIGDWAQCLLAGAGDLHHSIAYGAGAVLQLHVLERRRIAIESGLTDFLPRIVNFTSLRGRSSDLVAANRWSVGRAASQIAVASFQSFLLVFTKGRTNFA